MKITRAELKGVIIDIFEDFLEEKGIQIANVEHENDDGEAIIYGSDYDAIGDPLDRLFDNLKITQESEPWYTEKWYDEDIHLALEKLEIPCTEENLRKAKNILRNIFDDKSDRNEMIISMLEENM